MKATYLFAKFLAFALAADGCSKEPTSASKADFAVQLTSGEQVPSLTTAESGTASFWLNPTDTDIRYKLTVADLYNGTMAHLDLDALPIASEPLRSNTQHPWNVAPMWLCCRNHGKQHIERKVVAERGR